MLNLELVNYQDKLYSVYRKLKETRIKPEYIQDIKDFFMCDFVVKKQNQSGEVELFFLREIPELEILE